MDKYIELYTTQPPYTIIYHYLILYATLHLYHPEHVEALQLQLFTFQRPSPKLQGPTFETPNTLTS